MLVDDIYNNLESFWWIRTRSRAAGFRHIAIPFFESIHKGQRFTDEELLKHPYYEYVMKGWSPKYRSYRRAKKRFLGIVKDGIALYEDIKKNGVRDPIEMRMNNNRLSVAKGMRRIAILHLLGIKEVRVVIFRRYSG